MDTWEPSILVYLLLLYGLNFLILKHLLKSKWSTLQWIINSDNTMIDTSTIVLGRRL